MEDKIQDLFNKKLAEVGKDTDIPKPIHSMILNQTKSIPIEHHPNWWGVRAFLIASDHDKEGWYLTTGQRLSLRRN